ncbi:hypothetical protein GW17_00007636 [Ensete ventricosum]|nr:hypothetical protein GW17_00007636 [Ensete ventricosum]
MKCLSRIKGVDIEDGTWSGSTKFSLDRGQGYELLQRQERNHVVPWVPHSDGADSTCMVPKLKGASRQMHPILTKYLTEELSHRWSLLTLTLLPPLLSSLLNYNRTFQPSAIAANPIKAAPVASVSPPCNPRSPDRCPLLPLHAAASSLTNWCCHLPSLLRAAAFDRPHLLPSAPSEISDVVSRAQQRRCPSLVVTTSLVVVAAAPVLSPPLQPHFFLCPALPSLTPYRSRTILLLLSFPRCPAPTTPLLPSAPAAPASATTTILFLSREDSPATIASFATSSLIIQGKAKFAISICTARYERYIPIHQVTGTRTARYRAVPSKIDRRRSISAVGGRLKKKSTVGGRLRKKKGRRGKEKKKKRGTKNTSPARSPRSPVVAARGSPVRHHRPWVACDRFFSRARRRSVSPREETERLPTRGERSRRRCLDDVRHTGQYQRTKIISVPDTEQYA